MKPWDDLTFEDDVLRLKAFGSQLPVAFTGIEVVDVKLGVGIRGSKSTVEYIFEGSGRGGQEHDTDTRTHGFAVGSGPVEAPSDIHTELCRWIDLRFPEGDGQGEAAPVIEEWRLTGVAVSLIEAKVIFAG